MSFLSRSAFVLAIAAASCAPPASRSPPISGEWVEFGGTWTAVGTRHAIALGDGRSGAIINLTGTMLLVGNDPLGVGFRSEVIGLVDSVTGFEGRSVWVDEHGDQLFSELRGEGTADRNRITGTIISGTGRYTGATGSYEFSWQRVMEAEGSLHGRAVDLRGRVRSSAAGGPPR